MIRKNKKIKYHRADIAWLLVISLLFILKALNISAATVKPKIPIVFLPGIMGSRLCTNDDDRKLLWGGLSSYSNIDKIKLSLNDPANDQTVTTCGIINSVKVLGPFKIHQYDDLIEYLEEIGFVKDKTLFLFDYDWRQSNFVTAARFAKFIKNHIKTEQFDIVAHSMGGIVSRLYIDNHGGLNRVRRLITLGTPHRGSVKILRIIDSGWSWWQNQMGGGMTKIRETMLSFPSVYELLPSYSNCCLKSPPNVSSTEREPFDPFSIDFWKSIDWLPLDYHDQLGIDSLEKKLAEAKKVHELLAEDLPHSIKLIPVVSGLIDTVRRVHVDPKKGKFIKWVNGKGDGTVYVYSAANGRKIDARPATTEHARIFNNDSAKQVLSWALVDDIEPTSGGLSGDYSATINDKKGKRIRIVSIGLALHPPVIQAGEATVFKVVLTGQKALATTDLDAEFTLSDGSNTLRLAYDTKSKKGSDTTTTYTFLAKVAPPDRKGVYLVTVKLPGIDLLEEMLLVLP